MVEGIHIDGGKPLRAVVDAVRLQWPEGLP